MLKSILLLSLLSSSSALHTPPVLTRRLVISSLPFLFSPPPQPKIAKASPSLP